MLRFKIWNAFVVIGVILTFVLIVGTIGVGYFLTAFGDSLVGMLN